MRKQVARFSLTLLLDESWIAATHVIKRLLPVFTEILDVSGFRRNDIYHLTARARPLRSIASTPIKIKDARMKYLIIGMGHIGKALAKNLRQQGHQVVGTTTTPDKLESLKAHADQVVLLKGHETEKVVAAAVGCDGIIVTVAPNVRNTRTIEERHQHYQQVLVRTAESAIEACDRVVFLSSFSVYGDGGSGSDPITEKNPTGNHDEPSSKYYQQSENLILGRKQGCVLRFPDMYGAPGDLSFTERVKMAHSYFAGKTIFGADAPLYAIHFEDVVNSVLHALQKELTGVYNVCDNRRVPATNKVIFDAICDLEDLTRLEFLNQVKAPNRKVSADKIYQSGYQVQHDDPNAALLQKA